MNLRNVMLLILAGAFLYAPVFTTAQDVTPEPDVGDGDGGLTIHVVQRNENLFRIALAYNTSVADLVSLNGLTDATRIDIGQRLLVPNDEALLETAQIHIVQPGESLFSIGQLYGVDVGILASINQLDNVNSLYVGQELSISISDTLDESATTTDIIPTEVIQQPEIATGDESLPTVSSNIHIVAQGETLFRIATSYGLTTQELVQANGILDPTVIYAGQQLIIPNLPQSQISATDLPAPISGLTVNPLIFVEGETGVIEVITESSTTLSGTFLGRDLAFIAQEANTSHVAIVGIPVFTEAGVYTIDLTLDNADGTQTTFAFNIRVANGAYGSQNLNVTDANLTAPAVQDNELTLLTNLTKAVTLEKSWSDPFSIPAAAAMNSSYGTARSYNGGPISTFHSGADFATAPGTPIFASASGIVVLADALNIRGNTIVIDHGWGIYTAYAHQTTIDVALGERVVTGQVIGTAGSTGRVTGPHLHWEVWVNGVPVNPITWTQRIFPS